MKAGDIRAAWRALPIVEPEAFTGREPFLVISPHPDDESLGTGGLLAASAAAGTPAHVAVITDGAGSHPKSRRVPHDALVALRRNETAAAAAALGLPQEAITHLGLPDTQAPLAGAGFDGAVERLLELAAALRARTVLVTWRHDPHCDHEAAAAMAWAMRDARPDLQLWSYPVWGWHLVEDTYVEAPSPVGVRVAIAPWIESKRRAIASHVSQMTSLIDDDPDGFHFTPELLAPFEQPFEVLVEVPR